MWNNLEAEGLSVLSGKHHWEPKRGQEKERHKDCLHELEIKWCVKINWIWNKVLCNLRSPVPRILYWKEEENKLWINAEQINKLKTWIFKYLYKKASWLGIGSQAVNHVSIRKTRRFNLSIGKTKDVTKFIRTKCWIDEVPQTNVYVGRSSNSEGSSVTM